MSYGQYSSQPRPSRPDFDSHSTAAPRKSKRLRHIFDNPAHVWAHPLQKDGSGYEQDNARVAHGNWYFKTSSDGTRVIYSYRDSYPIGSRFELGRKTIFLLRSGKPYSSTTSGHMSATRQAVPKDGRNVEVFTVPYMTTYYGDSQPGASEHERNLAAYVEEITEAIASYAKSRSSWNIEHYLAEATKLTAEARRYARVFKTRLPALPKLPKLDAVKLAEIKKRETIRDDKKAAKRAAERAAWEAQHKAEVEAWQNGPDGCQHVGDNGAPIHTYSNRYACQSQRERDEWEATKTEKIAAWRRGENVRLRFDYDEPALLRVRTFGADESVAGLVGCVETSMHVQVPISGLAGAARLLRFLQVLKQSGRTYQRNGHSERIGNFVVDSFDGETLRAGCHRILWSEIESVATEVLAVEAGEQSQPGGAL